MKKMFSKILGYILYPFVKIIRYAALKLMKAKRPPGDRRPAIAAADHLLDEIVLPSVFRTFRQDGFREPANFKKLPVAEHDRIFNELEVSGICVAEFYLGQVKHFVKDGDFHFWRDVEELLSRQLQKKLTSLGVDGGNAKLMRQLINMRYREYGQLAEQIIRGGVLITPEFKNQPPEIKRSFAMMQAIAVGTADHIRRGKLEERDPLIKHLMNWFFDLQSKISKFVKNL